MFIMGYEYSPNEIKECIKYYEGYIKDNCNKYNEGYANEVFKNYSINTQESSAGLR